MLAQTKMKNQISFGGKVGYSIGETALNFLVGGISNYLLFFYTDVFGLAAGAAGILLLVSRIWDAINDPIMGSIVDRTKSRWGKYRPYILFGALPVAIFTVLTFLTPNFSMTGKLIWAYLTFNFWGMAFTAIAVPYNALATSLTTDSQERSSLSSIKTIFAAIGAMLVAVLAKPMTESFGGNLQNGYVITFAIFATAAVVIFLLCFKFTREKTELGVSKQVKGLFEQFKVLKGNRPLISLILFFIFFQIAFSMFRSVELYYFKYVLLRDSLFSVAVLVGSLCSVVGMVLMPSLVKVFDKKLTALLGGSVGCLFFLLMYVVPNNVTVAFIGIAFSYLFLSIPYALFFGILPDTVEYGQWKSGIRAAGFIVSTFTFTQKVGMAVAAASIGWVLDAAGYVANQAQAPGALHALLALRTIVPMGLVILGMVCFLFYNLDRKRHGEILKELQISTDTQSDPA
jgi:glycoside/pentoside/hexuronide:cation symporter, GPH family